MSQLTNQETEQEQDGAAANLFAAFSAVQEQRNAAREDFQGSMGFTPRPPPQSEGGSSTPHQGGATGPPHTSPPPPIFPSFPPPFPPPTPNTNPPTPLSNTTMGFTPPPAPYLPAYPQVQGWRASQQAADALTGGLRQQMPLSPQLGSPLQGAQTQFHLSAGTTPASGVSEVPTVQLPPHQGGVAPPVPPPRLQSVALDDPPASQPFSAAVLNDPRMFPPLPTPRPPDCDQSHRHCPLSHPGRLPPQSFHRRSPR